MKAFLLAAGSGTRLKPLTDSIPKCLLPINGKPLLEYWICLCELHGITEVLLNVHHLPEMVKEFIESRRWPIQIHLFFENELLGSAGTILANAEFVSQEKCFAVLYADNLTNADLAAMRQFHLRHNSLLTMGLFRAERPEQCGIAELGPENLIMDFVEKPLRPKSNLANAGIYWASPRILDFFPDRPVSDIGFDVLPRLIGKMHGYPITEYLLDIGTLDNYRKAQMDILSFRFPGDSFC